MFSNNLSLIIVSSLILTGCFLDPLGLTEKKNQFMSMRFQFSIYFWLGPTFLEPKKYPEYDKNPQAWVMLTLKIDTFYYFFETRGDRTVKKRQSVERVNGRN